MLTLIHPVQPVPREDHAETLRDHHTSISIGGRPIFKLRFADNLDLMGGSNCELQNITNRLVNRGTAHIMEISTEKRKFMTKSTNNISARINLNGQKLEDVTSFKYVAATLCDIRIRFASALAAMARLK